MLFLLINLISWANEPNASIVVTDSVYEEIYFEQPAVICDEPCHFEQDTSMIFVAANRHHHTWYRQGKVQAVYNDQTVKFNYPECNFKINVFKCANETGIWVMKTSVMINKDVATISLMLFDENGIAIGQSSISNNKKRTIINKKRVTQGQIEGPTLMASSCDNRTKNCATMPVQGSPQPIQQTEDLEPTVIETAPTLTERDISQAMIILYDSVR